MARTLSAKKPTLRREIEVRDEPDFGALLRVKGKGRIMKTNKVGFFVLKLCDGQHDLREIISEVSRSFRVSRRKAYYDVSKFIRKLDEIGIIES